MNVDGVRKFLLLCLGLLLLCQRITTKRPPKQGVSCFKILLPLLIIAFLPKAKVTRVKGQPEEEVIDDASLTLEIEHSIGRGEVIQ